MTSLADRISALSLEKRVLLERRLRDKAGNAAVKIIPRPRDGGPLPLSFAQQRLWLLAQLEPQSSFYNLPITLRLGGLIQIPVIELCLNELVRRHEALRTTFTSVNGRPVQLVAPTGSMELRVVDLRDVEPNLREAESARMIAQESARPFDLEVGPLLRASLLRLSATDHVLLLVMHHIISDGWSMNVLHRELSALYDAFRVGRPSPLPELPIQYADFAVWQRRWLQGSVLQKHLSYWKAKLANLGGALELCADRPRPAVQVFHGATYMVPLSARLLEDLKALGRQHDATLFMVLLAAFKVLLFRYSGQEDLAVGTPIANRTQVECEGLLGFFVNTLVMRTDLSGEPSFQELLARVREVTLGAYTHQEMPFEKLVEELQPERNLSHNPLFQVMFALQNLGRPGEMPQAAAPAGPQFSAGTSKFDLTLNATETADGLMLSFEYNTDLFDRETIEQRAAVFQTLLESIVSRPGERISRLALLRPEQRQRLLTESSPAVDDAPRARFIHEVCEVQAAKTPEAVAVTFGTQQLTYRELNGRANQLARRLRELGVGPERLVGLCIERSPEMLIGMLGILKAGGAYLPLDPALPQDRITYMLEDAGAQVVLTQESHRARFGSQVEQAVCLDADWPRIATLPDTDLPPLGTPDNLAYIIYTSGSTGRPKGVMVHHRGVCNMIEGQVVTFGMTADNRVLQFASMSFDASVFEIYLALRAGAVIHLVSKETLLTGQPLVDVLREAAITVAVVPPSVMASMPKEPLPALHTLIVGAEACPAELVTHWASGRRFFNAYGPTEASVWCISALCTPSRRAPPIGRPIPRVQAYVLDKHLEPVPVGMPGELYLGGDAVCRGYLGRQELTAERFIPDPFGGVPGARLYKTGDIVRLMADGNLHFIGRSDHQVKVRGFRIELGEIEATLLAHPGLREVAVTAQQGPQGLTRLVAYVVPRQQPAPELAELRELLRQRLPEYMVPSAFVVLEALPLNSSGKLDRRALPMPEGDTSSQRERTLPRNPMEETLARIWREVLEVGEVGVHDNFFELGGHSLLATSVMARVNAAFQGDIPLRRLFERPTVAELAEHIEQVGQQEPGEREPVIIPLSRAAHRKDLTSLSHAESHHSTKPQGGNHP